MARLIVIAPKPSASHIWRLGHAGMSPTASPKPTMAAPSSPRRSLPFDDEDGDLAALLAGTDPHDLRELGAHPISTPHLVATIVKSFVGSGVLFLPKAFQSGGWLFSVLVMIGMALVSQFTIMRLLVCRKAVGGTYGGVMRAAVGPWGQVAVDTSLVLSQAGFCCVYIGFIARNVLALLNANACWVGTQWLWLLILGQFFVFTPLAWVRRIAHFGPTNIAADVLIGAGLVVVLAYAINGIASTPGPIVLPLFNAADFSLFLGTAIYSYEGIGMIIPVFDSLAPVDQARFPRVLSATLAGVTVVYCIVGILPLIYLDGMAHVPMQDAVTLNLPRVWWSWAVIAGYCLALAFSYALMLHPAIVIIEGLLTHYGLLPAPTTASPHAGEPDVESSGGGGGGGGGAEQGMWRRNAVRAGIVACTLGVSLAGASQLNNFVSLIGAFCCCPLAFLYPCIAHLRLVKGAGKLSKAADVAIICFGAGVFVFSSYQSIASWGASPITGCEVGGVVAR